MIRNLLGLCSIVLLLVSSIAAQDSATEEVVKDEVEVSLFGGLGSPSGGISDFKDSLGAKSGFQLGVNVGYFATSRFVIGVSGTFTQMKIDNEEAGDLNHRLTNPGLYGKYYFFSESDLVPYVKAEAGVDLINFTTRVFDNDLGRNKFRQLSYTPSVSFGAAVGLHWYSFDYGGLFVEAGYHTVMSSDATAKYQDQEFTFGENIGLVNIRVGMNLFFGSE